MPCEVTVLLTNNVLKLQNCFPTFLWLLPVIFGHFKHIHICCQIPHFTHTDGHPGYTLQYATLFEKGITYSSFYHSVGHTQLIFFTGTRLRHSLLLEILHAFNRKCTWNVLHTIVITQFITRVLAFDSLCERLQGHYLPLPSSNNSKYKATGWHFQVEGQCFIFHLVP